MSKAQGTKRPGIGVLDAGLSIEYPEIEYLEDTLIFSTALSSTIDFVPSRRTFPNAKLYWNARMPRQRTVTTREIFRFETSQENSSRILSATSDKCQLLCKRTPACSWRLLYMLPTVWTRLYLCFRPKHTQKQYRARIVPNILPNLRQQYVDVVGPCDRSAYQFYKCSTGQCIFREATHQFSWKRRVNEQLTTLWHQCGTHVKHTRSSQRGNTECGYATLIAATLT